MTYRPEIDGLRAVAVLPVILFHAGVSQISGGYVGVDVFFVISGFLITGILARELEAGQFSIVGFYERRARRILPALFLVLTISSCLAFFIMLPYEFAAFGRGILAVIFFASNVLFWRESGYFAASSELNPLLHTWNLAVEEQFYILFPLFLWACWRWFRPGIVPLLILTFLVSLALAELLSLRMPSANFYLLPTRAWELLAGSLAALYLMKRSAPNGWLAEGISVIGLVAIIVPMFVFDEATPFPSAWTMVPVFGSVAIILAASPATWVGRLLGVSPLVGVGLISYSAYLWHQPLFAFARLVDVDGHPSQGVMLGLAVLALILAWLTWRFVERPFRGKNGFSRRGIFMLSGFGALSLAGFGLVAVLSSGLPQRYPEGQRDWITTGTREYGEYVRGSYRNVVGADFSEERPKLMIVGDSFSQDFYNIVLSAGAFENYTISAIDVPAVCQLHYAQSASFVTENTAPENRQFCENRSLKATQVAKMHQADVVIFSARWQPWAADLFAESLEAMELTADVYVVGSKSFQPNRRFVLDFESSNFETARVKPEDSVVDSTRILSSSLPNSMFVDTMKIMCGNGCPIFTENGSLISYDGLHLTPEGAAYMGDLVFGAPPLSAFIQGTP
ncbi:acyltransferase family protein [Pacificibacter sp.]|uniref:acyltransferase family protein n=1 Tax=Pacificibacter sp. TaxID=1917866 RepID=UPI003218E987